MIARRMKWLFTAVCAGLLVAASATYAQEKKDDKKEEIPKKVMDTLKAKFPKAEIDKWTKEKEGDNFFYDIEFKQGKQKFEADIREDGTIINWEKEIAAKDMPEAVKKALDKRYPKADIKVVMEITEVKDKKDVLEGYEIVIEVDKKEIEITIAPDGKVLEDTGEKKEEKKDAKKDDKR